MFTCGPGLFGGKLSFSDYAKSLSPVAFWRMQEISGTTLTDSISGAVATLTGSYTLNQTGMVPGGKAILLSGGFANTGTSATWSLGIGDFSMFVIGNWTSTALSCLANIRDGTNYNVLNLFTCNRLVSGDAETEGWYWSSGGQIGTGVGMNNGTNQGLCCVYVASSTTLYFYKKSGLVGSKVVGGTRPTASTMYVSIGTNLGTQNFSGKLSELLFFNKVITTTQISNLMGYIL